MIIDTIALTKALKTQFNKSFHEAPMPKYEPVITRVPSNAASETYGWLGAVPQLREWLGEKKVKYMKDYSYTITNKDWEATIAIDRNELEDDQAGIIKPRVQDLAFRAKVFPNKLVSDLVVNGTTNLAYDAAAFFSNRATNDNLLAGTGTTEAQILVDLAAARAAMMAFVDDWGDALEFEPDTIICPPALEITFVKIMESTTFITASAAGVKNFWSSHIKNIISDARLSDADDWYYVASGYPLKPFIYQERKAPKLVAQDKDTDDNAFMRKKYLYSAETRGDAGYGYYEMAVKTVN